MPHCKSAPCHRGRALHAIAGRTIDGVHSGNPEIRKRDEVALRVGPEIIDETILLANASLPVCIQRKRTEFIFNSSVMQSDEELLGLLRHAAQHWHRIILPYTIQNSSHFYTCNPAKNFGYILQPRRRNLWIICDIHRNAKIVEYST